MSDNLKSYARMCSHFTINAEHRNCPIAKEFNELNTPCGKCLTLIINETERFVKVVEKWNKENPLTTRQDWMLKLFPNITISSKGICAICPQELDCEYKNCSTLNSCDKCKEEYWLAEKKSK